jgi:hypothetical protein
LRLTAAVNGGTAAGARFVIAACCRRWSIRMPHVENRVVLFAGVYLMTRG